MMSAMLMQQDMVWPRWWHHSAAAVAWHAHHEVHDISSANGMQMWGHDTFFLQGLAMWKASLTQNKQGRGKKEGQPVLSMLTIEHGVALRQEQ